MAYLTLALMLEFAHWGAGAADAYLSIAWIQTP
jgi:hypothetical protein